MPRSDEPLRIAYLVYRGNPHCGGQGVYTRYLAHELTQLGHTVEVFSGQPYPELVDPTQLTRVPSLDLYRPENPFRVPWPWEFKTTIDLQEFAIMCAAGFPEPYTFSLRVRAAPRRPSGRLRHRPRQPVPRHGPGPDDDDGWPSWPRCTTPSPSTATSTSPTPPNAWRRFTLRRWYGFLDMQMRVARQIPRVVTVSESSKRDIVAQMGVAEDRLHVVPVGMDPDVFGPRPDDRPRARPPHDHGERRRADEGSRPAARGAGEGPHRARRRPPRRDRQGRRRRARSPACSTGSASTARSRS